MMRTAAALATLLLSTAVLAGCTGDDQGAAAPPSSTPASAPASASGTPTAAATLGEDDGAAADAEDPDLDPALSTPVEDSVYPDVGDPSVDALHYDLDLAWTPETRTLEGDATIELRSTTDADHLQLDFSGALDISSVTLDGDEVDYTHEGKDLVVSAPVTEDGRYVLEVRYTGTPKPTAAPTTRSDFNTSGWTITDDGEVWTMQEPYGGFTWYPVNDQPSDKALYDFTITAPSPWTGVANGELTDQTEQDGLTTTTYHLAEPAAAYLVTVAIGDYTRTTNRARSGVEISYWVPSDRPGLARGLQQGAGALEWVEDKLGPYPFDTLGFVLVDSRSGMETQTMITLGTTDYTTSMAVLVHEIVHQWYGDEVTPDDWRDVWMNEGMAMYLQGMWQAEQDNRPIDDLMDEWATFEPDMRRVSGPPAAYDPAQFGEGNIYYGPALMWHELRKQIGDERFFALIRDWPARRPGTNAGRDDFLPWLVDRTGVPASFFESWLLDPTTPPRA